MLFLLALFLLVFLPLYAIADGANKAIQKGR